MGQALTVGSLFAGIGGFDLGFERAGFEIKWQVEIDPFCRAVLAKHWPAVRRYEDVRIVGSELARVDVLCGGFPCQDISVAGAGAGLDGARSGLWREFARLIRELRPRYVVVENVSALLGRGIGRVLGDLAACGYDAEWDCLPASAFGAPHRRDRLWLVAYTNVQRRDGNDRVSPAQRGELRNETRSDASADGSASSLADADGGRSLQPQGRQQDERRRASDGCMGNTMRAGLPLTRHAGTAETRTGRIFTGTTVDGAGWWATEPHVGRVAHGVPARVDRLRGLGNAVVPQITEWIARRLLAAEGVEAETR